MYPKREGFGLGWDRMFRLWQQAQPKVPKNRPRRRVAAYRPRSIPATGPNQAWAYDFAFDACAYGVEPDEIVAARATVIPRSVPSPTYDEVTQLPRPAEGVRPSLIVQGRRSNVT